jgi:hypothetical protein
MKRFIEIHANLDRAKEILKNMDSKHRSWNNPESEAFRSVVFTSDGHMLHCGTDWVGTKSNEEIS